MLTRILSYHQVMPEFLDFVSVFGFQDNFRNLRFSAFKQQFNYSSADRVLPIAQLGRSEQRYQICYNLRAVGPMRNKGTQHVMYSVHQAAFHHQFDINTGRSLWITIKGDLDLKARVAAEKPSLCFGTPAQCFKSSLDIHLVHFRWAAEGWTRYLSWLEDRMDTDARYIKSITTMDLC